MATTTNYSWTTPDDTALVKDGAAAIRSLGTAIDSTVFTNAGAAIPKTLIDAEGDLIVGDAADAVQRLAVGSDGNVLTVDTTVDGKIKWAAPASSSQSFSLLNSGGTSLSGSSVTISSISGKGTIHILVIGAIINSNEKTVQLQINSDTGANYNYAGHLQIATSTYQRAGTNSVGATGSTFIPMAQGSEDSTTCVMNGGFTINGANSTGIKIINSNGGATPDGFPAQWALNLRGVYTGSSTVSSITIKASAGSFTAGTVYVYASA
jgi:hypothetical protein